MTRKVKIGLMIEPNGTVYRTYKSVKDAHTAQKRFGYLNVYKVVEGTLELPDDVYFGKRDRKNNGKVKVEE